MSFKQILRALTCTFALVGSASSFAIAPDQPSQTLSMLEVLVSNPGGNPFSTMERFSSLDARPSHFDLLEQKIFDTRLGKEVLSLGFYISGPYGERSFVGFTVDPDHPVGDVGIYAVSYASNAPNFPNVSYPNTTLDAQNFIPTQKRFSIIDLQRDASGQIVSLAASFDIWGRYFRDPIQYQLIGRFWYNSAAAIPVPEPDTTALLLAGLTMAAVMARRQAHKPR